MSIRNFLIPFAAALAALSTNSNASVDTSQNQPSDLGLDVTPAENTTAAVMRAGGELLLPSGNDLFKFVLKRAESGEMVAYHYSHRSHSSHSSHSSHRSHYSSRY